MSQSFPQSLANSQEEDLSEPVPDSSTSGMIVFSSSGRILHINRPARALMKLFGASHDHWPLMAPDSTPSILTELCDDVLAQLCRRIEMQDCAQLEIHRICHMVTPPLLFTGFGVQNSTDCEIRIILTITPLLSAPCDATDSQYLHQSAGVHPSISSATL